MSRGSRWAARMCSHGCSGHTGTEARTALPMRWSWSRCRDQQEDERPDHLVKLSLEFSGWVATAVNARRVGC